MAAMWHTSSQPASRLARWNAFDKAIGCQKESNYYPNDYFSLHYQGIMSAWLYAPSRFSVSWRPSGRPRFANFLTWMDCMLLSGGWGNRRGIGFSTTKCLNRSKTYPAITLTSPQHTTHHIHTTTRHVSCSWVPAFFPDYWSFCFLPTQPSAFTISVTLISRPRVSGTFHLDHISELVSRLRINHLSNTSPVTLYFRIFGFTASKRPLY